MSGPAAVLAPLAARYRDRPPAGSGSGGSVEDSDEDPAQVRAMPVVLRVERAERPSRTALLEAAASAAVAVCLDKRSEPGGEWHDAVASWVAGRIRKVARRARGTHWTAVGEPPGVTVTVRGAQARALVPMRVADTPPEVSRLQITGTDLPADSPGAVPPGVPVVWLNPALELTVGKAAAQVGHATVILAAALPAPALARWHADGLRCAVRVASAERWRSVCAAADRGDAVAVRDAGFTEVAPGTVTCAAQWKPPAG